MTMSFKKMGKGSAAGNYYVNSAGLKSTVRGVDDYYQQAVGTEPNGTFTDHSSALKAFGIDHGDEVSVVGFQNLLSGRDPVSGEPLIDIVDEKHVSGFDCTMSPPKHFSTLFAVSDEKTREKLLSIIDKSNASAMQFLSDKAGITRRGKGGLTDEKVSLISAAWRHSTSRAADPQIHIHNTVFNVVKRADGSWGTIESKHLMQWQTAAGTAFRAALATGLKEAFPSIDIVIDEKKGNFVIGGIPDDLIEHWSKRTAQIEEHMKESGGTTFAASDVAKLETRVNKTFDETPKELDVRWKSEAKLFNFDEDSVNNLLYKNANNLNELNEFGITYSEQKTLDAKLFEERMDAIPAQLIEKDSVFTEQQLYRRVAELSAGIQDIDGIQSTVDRLLKRSAVDVLDVNIKIINVKEINYGDIRSGINSRINAGSRSVDGRNLGRFSANSDSRSRSSSGERAKNLEPSIDAINAARSRRGEKDGVRTLSESRMARQRPSKTESLLRNNARDNRRTFINLRRNVLDKPVVKTEREIVIEAQNDPQSVIIAAGMNDKKQVIYTTLAQIRLEADLKKRSEEMANDGSHFVDQHTIDKAIFGKSTMTIEQAEAVRWALSPGSLKIVEGGAGTGKSFSLDVVRQISEESGYKVHGIALSWQAASVLQSSANINSSAITGFLNSLESGKIKLNEKSLLVCDENGLVGSAYGQKLLEMVQKAGAKIIITGDSNQLNPVSAGSAMKIMLTEAGSAKITEIRRQKELWAREMVADFSVGKSTKALAALDERGNIHRLEDRKSTIDKVSSDFYNYLKKNPGKSALALCGSNAEAQELNASIREMKRADGTIGRNDVAIQTEYGELNFAAGDKIMFRKNDKKLEVTNRNVGILISITPVGTGHQLKIKLENGVEVNVDTRKYKGDEGKLPIHHGDAMTVYSSQGATVDETFVMHSNSTDRRLAYVAYSRHKENTNLYIDNSSVISNMKAELAADEFYNFKPTEADILNKIAKQYHVQSKKVTTYDYLDQAKISKILDAHKIPEVAAKVIETLDVGHVSIYDEIKIDDIWKVTDREDIVDIIEKSTIKESIPTVNQVIDVSVIDDDTEEEDEKLDRSMRIK